MRLLSKTQSACPAPHVEKRMRLTSTTEPRHSRLLVCFVVFQPQYYRVFGIEQASILSVLEVRLRWFAHEEHLFGPSHIARAAPHSVVLLACVRLRKLGMECELPVIAPVHGTLRNFKNRDVLWNLRHLWSRRRVGVPHFLSFKLSTPSAATSATQHSRRTIHSYECLYD